MILFGSRRRFIIVFIVQQWESQCVHLQTESETENFIQNILYKKKRQKYFPE